MPAGGGAGRGGGRRGRGGQSSRGDGRPPTTFASEDGGFVEMNAHLPERFRGRQRQDLQQSNTNLESGLDLALNTNIRDYIAAQDSITNSSKAGSWRCLTEMPTNEEIAAQGDEIVTLTANKIKGKWKSTEKYLKAHYELLREDAVSPLRKAVLKFRQNPDMEEDQSVSIYEKVHIAGLTFSQMGIAVRIRFSTARSGRKILWGSSKRLTSGTIVALTPAKDKFSSKCIVAVVAARPLQGVELTPCEIDIYFAHAEDLEVDPQEEWLMLESKTGYYEAYRHTLRAVQKLSQESFPLSDHICSLVSEIAPPAYVTDNPIIDMSAVTNDASRKALLEKTNILQDWPASAGDALDETQWAAMQQMLTKCLSVVQGPPGTGKTHNSRIALEILVKNRRPGDPPIIIAAQTNHALDQLLSHVSVFDSNYIRLGGRSTNSDVKQRALYEVRLKERIPLIPGGKLGQSGARLKAQSSKIIEIVEPLNRGCSEPFSAKLLFELEIMTDSQYQSLEKGAAEWVSSEEQQESAIQLWLNKALLPFNVTYKQENFGFQEAEEDFEFEQLKEQEAENGVADEEDIEMLKGQWCHLEDRFTVSHPSASTLDKAKRQLDTVQDLWKVPDYLRGPIYSIMQAKVKKLITVKVRDAAQEYNKITQDVKVGKWERDAIYLQRANIVGLTTTGLSKYRPLIASLKPKIILIEEAAEVIEAPVTAACVESLEHLILVGDHQQLQGHCSDRELENEPFYLNISMFERLIKNGIPYKTLLRQRRMDPEFRRLLIPIYPQLEDHPVVVGREVLPFGVGDKKSFFFDHEFSELKDSQLSTYNDKEAEFIAEFYKYLLKNGATTQGITILTFYNGQRKRILKYLRDDPMTRDCYNNVKTVDAYQGEENNIVILSLVRSNDDNKIGFLEVDNRVCVSLSRAKFGFYLFGNARLLLGASPLWHSVVTTMSEEPLRIGYKFPITCKNHDRTTEMAYPEDWAGNDGGCDQPCGSSLPCGHACDLKCHPYPHEKLRCLRECDRPLVCGHACTNNCYEPCYCHCETFSKHPKDEFDDPFSGEGSSGKTQQPTSSGTKVGAWGNSTASSAFRGPMDVRGNNNNTGGNQTHTHRQSREQSSYAERKKGEARQVLAQAPYGGRAQESDDLVPAIKQINSVGPPGFFHNSQKSSSSAASLLTTRSATHHSKSQTTYFQAFSHSSQHSLDKQGKGIRGWTGYANGGVEKQDQVIAMQASLDASESEAKFREITQPLLDLDIGDGSPVEGVSPVKSETVRETKNGRKVFKQEFQRYISFGFGELARIDGASSSRVSPKKAVQVQINLLD